MRMCLGCQDPIPSRTTINGKSYVINRRRFCLACRPFKYRENLTPEDVLQKRRERQLKHSKDWYRRKRAELGEDPITAVGRKRKRFLLSLVDSRCQFCGYNAVSRNLVFHHVTSPKLFTLSIRQLQRSSKSLFLEALKCVVACHNCHGEIHEGLLDANIVIQQHQIFSDLLLTQKSVFLSLSPRGVTDSAGLS